MIKTKPCKGSGKAKGYGCNNDVRVQFRKYGLCPSCYGKWLYSTDEGAKQVSKLAIKSKKINDKRKSEESKQLKDTIINWRSKLQTEIQKISRLIDIGLPCLARGYHPQQMHGGHVFAKGGNKTIALNLHNIHRQGAQSNTYQNDDGLLREGLVKEYGQSYMDFISELRQCKSLEYNNLEYKVFYRLACKISLELKREGGRFELKERVDARNKINKELGIYTKEFCIFTL